MGKIYTLRKPFTDERGDALNGKMFNIFVNTDGDKKVLFRDAITGDNLWITTRIVISPTLNADGGIIFVTSSGTCYDLINVETLIPTDKAVKKVDPSPIDAVDDTVPKATPAICSLTEKETRELLLNIFDIFDRKLLDSFDAKGIKTVGHVVDYLKNKEKFSAVLAKAVSFTKRATTEKMIVNCLRSLGYKIDAVYPDDCDWDDDDCTWEVKGFESQDFKSSLDLKLIYALTEYKPINYGNGYDKTTFVFNRELSEAEFIQFLNENKYQIHEQEGWWDDHSKIEGKGQKWIYTWVRVYTD